MSAEDQTFLAAVTEVVGVAVTINVGGGGVRDGGHVALIDGGSEADEDAIAPGTCSVARPDGVLSGY